MIAALRWAGVNATVEPRNISGRGDGEGVGPEDDTEARPYVQV